MREGCHDLLERAKLSLETFKQFLIAIILACFLFYPAGIRGALDKMGIDEGDLWGLKFKKSVVKTDNALQQAQADKDQLTSQLNLANDTIRKQSEIILAFQNAPEAAPRSTEQIAVASAANRLVEQNQSAIDVAQRNTQSAQQTIVANSPLISRAQTDDAQPNAEWAILAGSDPTEAAAADQIRRAREAGFPDAKLFHNKNYRTTLVYSDRQVASDALTAVKARVRPDSYMVNLDKWCPNRRQVRPDLVECGT